MIKITLALHSTAISYAKDVPDVLDSLVPALLGTLVEGAGDQVLLVGLNFQHLLLNAEKEKVGIG